VIITDGNLNILNDIYLDMNEKSNRYSFLVGFLHKNILVNRSSPICGQCVHIDRARIERIMPEFISCCHYRNIDVDVLNVLCRRWAKNVYENRPYVKYFFESYMILLILEQYSMIRIISKANSKDRFNYCNIIVLIYSNSIFFFKNEHFEKKNKKKRY
jgi:hypothetical protein